MSHYLFSYEGFFFSSYVIVWSKFGTNLINFTCCRQQLLFGIHKLTFVFVFQDLHFSFNVQIPLAILCNVYASDMEKMQKSSIIWACWKLEWKLIAECHTSVIDWFTLCNVFPAVTLT